jgi:hypothetical protein
MKHLYAYWRYTCERCNCKESVEAPIVKDKNGEPTSRVEYTDTPKDWLWIDRKLFCGACAVIIRNAMERIS